MGRRTSRTARNVPYDLPPERLVVVNGRGAAWAVTNDPAERFPALGPARILGLMPQRARRRRPTLAKLPELLHAARAHDREALYMALLDGNRIAAVYLVGVGGADAVAVDTALILRTAFLMDVDRIALLHNHPSGDTQPSPEDIALTERVKRLGDRFGIELVDHMVLGREGVFSFRQAGLM